MIKSKTFPMAMAMLGLGAATSFADIKLTDNLSTVGFLDMSLNGYAPDSGDATLNASFDQFEIDFMYKFGSISARADINALPSTDSAGLLGGGGKPGGNNSTVFLEQGFVSYNYASGLSLSTGRFLSSSGFEAAEPTGLFQYSTSKTLVYGYYQNGVNLSYTAPKFGLYGAVVSDLWNPQEFDVMKSPGFEGQVSVMPVDGVTAKAAFLYQIYDTTGTGANDKSQSLFNVWAQYAKGPLTVAAEYNQLISWAVKGKGDDLSGMGFLVMGNYKITDKIAATLRYSALDIDDKNSATKDYDSEITVSPSFAISGNWLVLAEAKYEFLPKKFDYAAESTFSF